MDAVIPPIDWAALLAAAAAPKEAANETESATAHSLTDLIKLAQFQANAAAVRRPGRGLRFTRISPPGTTD